MTAMDTRHLMAPSARDEFSRYEFKYLLNAEQRSLVEDEIANFMVFDGHVHDELDNSYYVRSLYFDNSDASHYYEKIDGTRVRRKFRIRTYDRKISEGLPIFLEEKGRFIERTFKNRIRLSPEDLQLFYNAEKHDQLLGRYPDEDIVERFVFASLRKRITPQVVVDYIRRPYVSNYDLNFRVTFDNALNATCAHTLFPELDISHWRLAEAGYTILEVKFHRRIPAWFHRIIQSKNMRRLSISKFCKGMEVCGLAVDLS